MVLRQQESKNKFQTFSLKFPRNSAHENFQYNIPCSPQSAFSYSSPERLVRSGLLSSAQENYSLTRSYKSCTGHFLYTLYRAFYTSIISQPTSIRHRLSTRSHTIANNQSNHSKYFYTHYYRGYFHNIIYLNTYHNTKVHKHPYTSITISIIYYIFIYYI